MERMNPRAKGSKGEDLAVKYLMKKGFKIVKRNFVFGRGEIDIVAEDGNILVFVEVKARKSNAYGTPEESITVGKRRQLRRIAEGYMYVNKIDNRECRFDAIAIEYKEGKAEIRHLVNAF